MVDIISGIKLQVSEYTASRDVLVYVYGAQLVRLLDRVLYNGSTIRETIEREWPEATFVVIPSIALLNQNNNGFVVYSQELVTLNYTRLPIMSEMDIIQKIVFWGNFEMGSNMVDVEEYGAAISQPLTFKSVAAAANSLKRTAKSK